MPDGVAGDPDSLWDFYETRHLVDCTVKLEWRTWHCHRLALSLRSRFFRAAFKGGVCEVDLPLPPFFGDAFEMVLPFLYDGTPPGEIDVEESVPLLVVSCVLGVPKLTDRLQTAISKMMESSPLACIPLLCELTSPEISAAFDCHPVGGAGMSEAVIGAREAKEACETLKMKCVATVSTELPSLGKAMHSLTPEGLMCVLNHPNSQRNQHLLSTLVADYILHRENDEDTSDRLHLGGLTQRNFSQLSVMVKQVPEDERLVKLMRAAVRRKDVGLMRVCLVAAHSAVDKVENLEGKVMEVFKEFKEFSDRPEHVPYPTKGRSAKRQREEVPDDSQCSEDITQKEDPAPKRIPDPELTASSDVLFESTHPDLMPLNDEDEAKYRLDDPQPSVDAIPELSLSQPSQEEAFVSVLRSLSNTLAVSRQRRTLRAQNALRETKQVISLNMQSAVRGMHVMWCAARDGAQQDSSVLRNQLTLTQRQLRQAEEQLQGMQGKCDELQALINGLALQCGRLEEGLGVMGENTAARIEKARAECSTLVDAWKDDTVSIVKELESKVSHAAHRNTGAVRRLSEILTRELANDD